jgi:murein DD-endopeptidase MepM/ murein hydrolase activator NlpD
MYRTTALLLTVALAAAGAAPESPPRGRDFATVASNQDRRQQLDRQLDDLRESLEGTSKALVDAAVNLKRAQARMGDARAKLASAQKALGTARKRDAALADRLALAEAALGKAGRDLAARRDEEDRTRTRLAGIAREAYLSSGLSGLSIALDAQSPQQFADRVNVAGAALRAQSGALARLEVQQADTRARRAKLKAAQDQVADLKRESEVLVARRAQAEKDAGTAAAQVRRLVDLKARSVRTIQARRSAEKKRLAALQKEQDRLARLLRKRAHHHRGSSGGTISGNGSGRLSQPVNAPITSGFGWRYHPILHYKRLHAGTDFGAACGTPVRAAAAGTVVRAGRAGGFGNQVVLDHGRMKGKNLATSYNHLSRFVVRHGHVRRGQVIAYSGTTGLSTGCHLHFEVYVNGTHVNPMSWL